MKTRDEIKKYLDSNTEKWWLSAQPSEVRVADDIVDRFIRRTGSAGDQDIEVFARAIALSQVLKNHNAFVRAAEEAHSVLANVRTESVRTLDANYGTHWYQSRGAAIEKGLDKARKLLGAVGDGAWDAAFERYKFYLELCRVASTREDLVLEAEKRKRALAVNRIRSP